MKKNLLKLLGAVVAIVIYWLGFVNGMHYEPSEEPKETVVLSDKQIMDQYISENFGNRYYGVLMDVDEDEYIDFTIYSDDYYGVFTMCSLRRELYQ